MSPRPWCMLSTRPAYHRHLQRGCQHSTTAITTMLGCNGSGGAAPYVVPVAATVPC